MRHLLTLSVALPHPPLPRPALQTGRGGQQYYKDGARYQAYKALIAQAARNELPEDWVLYDGPVMVQAVAEFDVALRPKSRSNEVWHLKTPDTDNLFKPIQDALTKVVWFDDRSAPACRFAKVWGEENRVTIRVSALDWEDVMVRDVFALVFSDGERG